MRFTTERREQFLSMLERGHTQEEACAHVGISRTTIVKWTTRGRLANASAEASEFAERFDAIKDCAPFAHLSDDDLIRLLEKQAKKGSVNAIRLLLERPWEKKRGKQDDDGPQQDPFAELDGPAGEAAAVVDLATHRADRG